MHVIVDLVSLDVSPADDHKLGSVLECNATEYLKADFLIAFGVVKKNHMHNVTN